MLDVSLSEGRYTRHHILPEIGYEGQKRLGNARVLVVGAGGLGAQGRDHQAHLQTSNRC